MTQSRKSQAPVKSCASACAGLIGALILSTGTVSAQTAETPPTQSPPVEVQAVGPKAIDTIIGEGTPGSIAKFIGPNRIGNSVIAQDSGNIGIGTNTPEYPLTVLGSSTIVMHANNSSTAANANAIWARISSTIPGAGSAAVRGVNRGTGSAGYGLWGTHAGSGNGVRGESISGTGVSGQSTNGTGVGGVSTNGFGMRGISTNTSGVVGQSTAGTGIDGISGTGFGVHGVSTSGIGAYGRSDGGGYGVQGVSTNGNGVHGFSTNATGTSGIGGSNGVSGVSTNGTGVRGVSTNATGTYGRSDSGGYGVHGVSNSGNGVYGQSTSNDGVVGQTGSSDHAGVAGSNTGSGNGIYGESVSGYAGYFVGDVHATGTLTAGNKDFKIDHPLDPARKYLVHASIESSDMLNLYTGNVTTDGKGTATVTLPAWFGALNKEFRYQLTCIGGYAPVYVAQEIKDNRFKIAGGKPGMKISWQVTGIRKDAYARDHRIRVEQDKGKDRGFYLYPAGFGQPREKTVGLARRPEPKQAKPVNEKLAKRPNSLKP